MSEPTHGQLLAAIKGIEATLCERRRSGELRRNHLANDIGEIKASIATIREEQHSLSTRIRALENLANKGLGGLGFALKIGAGLVILLSGLAYIWEHFLKYIR